MPATAQAVVQVTTTVDEQDNSCSDGDCSLRDAIGLANGSAEVVQVPAGTYPLDRGSLALSGVTIQGAGAGLTTIRGVETRVVSVFTGTNAISGVTVSGGTDRDGGGIFVGVQGAATLALSDSTVTANLATSANAFGGGIAVASSGVLLMTSSTVSANRVIAFDGQGLGGGISVDRGGRAEIRNSTVSGNIVEEGSPAVGGGIGTTVTGIVVLENVTLSSNSAPTGGGIAQYQPSTGVTATISDTIVAGNAGAECSPAPLQFAGNHNLADDATCGFGLVANPLLGPLQINPGPGRTATHALLAGSPAIDAGDPTTCKPTDQRGVARPQLVTCDIGAFEYVPPPPPPPAPPPPSPPPEEQLPPPTIRKTVNVTPKSGTVRIKLKGKKRFTKLTEGQQIPIGSIIDTRKGRVTLTAAADKKGKTATADFYEGLFKVGQTKGKKPFTELKLTEKLSCSKRGKASTAAKRKTKRRLWGDGKGRFRTKGQYSSATVRGTIWLTQDHCDRTWTKVTKGSVKVRDFVNRKTIIVRKGKDYIARARRR